MTENTAPETDPAPSYTALSYDRAMFREYVQDLGLTVQQQAHRAATHVSDGIELIMGTTTKEPTSKKAVLYVRVSSRAQEKRGDGLLAICRADRLPPCPCTRSLGLVARP